MIAPMKQVNIIGKKQQLKDIIDTLKSTVSFEMSYLRRAKSELTESDSENHDRLTTLLARVKAVLTAVQKAQTETGEIDTAIWTSVSELDYKELKSITNDEDFVLNSLDELESNFAKLKDLKSQIEKNIELVKELQPFAEMPIELSALQNTKNTFVLCGLISPGSLEKYKKNPKLANIVINEYPSVPGKVCVLITGHRDQFQDASTVSNFRFERCKFSFEQTAAEQIRSLGEVNESLKIEYREVLHKCLISTDNIQMLKVYYDYITNEINTYELLGKTKQTKKHYVATGWIVKSDEQRITEIIQATNPDVMMEIKEPEANENPPVVFINKKLIEPYQTITNLYGAPSKDDIDPNPFVAFFYFVFFGLMVGDMGYGILLSAATLLFIRIKKPAKGMKNMLLLFCMGGVSAIIWGFIFGSFFGFGRDDGLLFLPNPVFDPMNAAIQFMVLSFALGVIHIMSGIALNGWNALRHGKVFDCILDSLSRLVMFVGIIMYIASIFVPALAILSKAGMYTALGALGVIVLTNGRKRKGLIGKIVGGFSGAYSLVGYFSDIVSYARLFGLALVGAVIALAGNAMGDLLFAIPVAGIPIGIIVMAFFHVFNLALGLLGTYVHNARLQFVEFFSKFYQGEGRIFQPTAAQFKYTKLKAPALSTADK